MFFPFQMNQVQQSEPLKLEEDKSHLFSVVKLKTYLKSRSSKGWYRGRIFAWVT